MKQRRNRLHRASLKVGVVLLILAAYGVFLVWSLYHPVAKEEEGPAYRSETVTRFDLSR